MWGKLSLCGSTLSWGISCWQDVRLIGSMTNISVWGIFLVKKMVSSHLFHVIFVHKGKQQSPLKKKNNQRWWWSCYSNGSLALLLRGVFLMLFHSQECFFSCSSYKHLNIIIRDFTSGYFYEIERKAPFFFNFKLFCRLLDCFTARYVEKYLLPILRFWTTCRLNHGSLFL